MMDFHAPYVDRWFEGKYKSRRDVRQDPQKAVFLDIDGVIQPYNAELRHEYNLNELCKYLREKYNNRIYLEMDKYDVGAAYYDWDTVALGRVREMVKRYNAGIILHTGWCWANDLRRMRALFALYGMDDLILDQVDGRKPKDAAINEFLDAHPELENYVIIDDDRLLQKHFLEHLVLTDNVITEKDCDIVARIFGFKN